MRTRVWREADHPRDTIGRFDEPPGSPTWLKRNHGGRVPSKWADRVSDRVDGSGPAKTIRTFLDGDLDGLIGVADPELRDTQNQVAGWLQGRLSHRDPNGLQIEVNEVVFQRLVHGDVDEDSEEYWDEDLDDDQLDELASTATEVPAISVFAKIKNADGEEVGRLERFYFRDPDDGKLTVGHREFKITRRGLRGQGLATRYGEVQDQLYRDIGIQKVTLEANYDVGGYAWAKAGYDWRDKGVASAVMDDLEMVIYDEEGWEILEDQRGLGPGKQPRVDHTPDIEDAFDQMKKREQAGDPPTPLEIAMLGWVPGASMWFGKAFLLGASWRGVRHL